jgi:peptide/nickel transport system permease protein
MTQVSQTAQDLPEGQAGAGTSPWASTEEIRKEEETFLASQWKLTWWKFLEHKMAVAGGITLALLYFVAIFCEFLAPYTPMARDSKYATAPPQRIRFVDEDGFHLQPFVYAMESTRDPNTMLRAYTNDEITKYPLKLFVRGQEYKMWGFLRSNLHLFGTETGVAYLFGTDTLGRDMLTRIMYGARISLTIGLIGVMLSFLIGLTIGGIAGFFGGWVDNLIQRLIEVIRAFPSLPLWMSLSAALPVKWSPLLNYFGITVVLSLVGWTSLARVTRGKILSLKNEDFVVAAEISGASRGRIIRVHLIPSFLSHIIAGLTLAIPGMILGETTLSFLGLGLRDPVVSWGVLMQKSQNIHSIAFTPWLFLPGLFIVITVLSFNFFGDGLRDAADPYTAAT